MKRGNIDIDLTRFNEAITIYDTIRKKKQDRGAAKSEVLYLELFRKYLQRTVDAAKEGKFMVGHSTSVPSEIFRAMDIVPALVVATGVAVTVVTRMQEECFLMADELFIPQEVCAGHRAISAMFKKGFFPPLDAIVYIGLGCDPFSYSPRVGAYFYGVPQFQIDPPYYENGRSIQYITQEFRNLVHFLEEHSQRKMDWNKLEEVVKLSMRQYELFQEIRNMRKSIPSPMESKRAWQANWINWLYAGTPEGVMFFETLRNELKDRLEQKKSPYPEEKFRILDLFMSPTMWWNLLDEVASKYGMVFVCESLIRYSREWEYAPSKPLETLAQKWRYGPLWCTQHGPVEEWIELAVEDAKDYKADGAIFWANRACRQVGAIRGIKDALQDKCGIPAQVIDNDLIDPTFVTKEEVENKIHEFIEILESRKRP